MKLRRLQLHGFKTFAQQTEFVFPSGITALVGPNGSGKSNIADAIRWVMGEQSLRAVRGKRTEDVIFAGSTSRSSAGMAEVSITLDNSSGWLPIPYAEVSLTRRAYRSGENEYLMNNSRVRLRDVNELLIRAGLSESAFVVIGQGLVDLALSLRADERRALIDEAADVKRFQVKLDETRDRLDTSEQALTRARDLLAEIEPRVAALSDQADRLRRHQSVAEQLREAQRLWHREQRDLLRASHLAVEERVREADAGLAATRKAAEEQELRRAALERHLGAARASVASLRGEYERGREEVEQLRRRSAILAERRAAQAALRAELEHGLAALDSSHQSLVVRHEEFATACRELESAVEADEKALQDEARDQSQQADDDLTEQLDRAARLSQRLRERAAVLRDQCRSLDDRQRDVTGELARWQAVVAGHDARSDEAAAKVCVHEGELKELDGQRDALTQEAGRLAEDIAAREARMQDLAAQARRFNRTLDERRARVEVLERWSDAQAYSAGVRAVLRAGLAHKGKPSQLAGVIGVAAELIRVPRDLETAIEVALGGRAQDVVVQRWADAEAAIALLKAIAAGRATFLPLDTLRVPMPANPFRSNEVPGLRGVAAELVESDTAYAKVVQHLLGRTVVVDTLPTARRVLVRCPAGWQIVTVEGEIVRTSGAVTGGARRGTEAGLLVRQRELRDLRQDIEALERDAAFVGSQLATERAKQVARRQELAEVERAQRGIEQKLRQTQTALLTARAEQRSLAEQRQMAESACGRQSGELERLAAMLAKARAELDAVDADLAAAADRHSNLERRWRASDDERRQGKEALNLRRTALAVRQRELDGLRDRLRASCEELEQIDGRRQEQHARLGSVVESDAVLAEELGIVDGRLSKANEDIDEIQVRLKWATGAADEQSDQLRDLDKSMAERREGLAELAARRRELDGELQRIGEQIVHLRQQAAAELGPALAGEVWREAEGSGDRQPAEALKRAVEALRAALRAIGSVNPNAIEDHAEIAERHSFLSRQVHDIEETTVALRRLSAELQKSVRERFERAFLAVDKEFRRYFTQLFEGGSARLALTEADDGRASGVEIIARPPGRRLQNLALLSGGERALTAAALLFAILAVRPMPFCVLDEVDAALDEANVGRFCDALRGLANDTQFLVITHNRATMETADSLYGITMPADSCSQVVSLRLSDGVNEGESADVQSFEPSAAPRR